MFVIINFKTSLLMPFISNSLYQNKTIFLPVRKSKTLLNHSEQNYLLFLIERLRRKVTIIINQTVF